MRDEIDHPTLGLLTLHFERGWIGQIGAGPDRFDLVIMFPSSVGEFDNPLSPSTDALSSLEDLLRSIGATKARAVNAVCAAREARLNWRTGPAVEAWSVVEACIDRDGGLWLNLHEYETDEYSRWLVRLDGQDVSQVRRVPALDLRDAPGAAGVLV